MKRIFFIFVIVAAAGLIYAQDQQDQHFIEIIHTADGTEAIDSTGESWYYDSESGKFVPSRLRGSERRGESGRETDDDFMLPAEVRCTDVYYGDLNRMFDEVRVESDERIEGSVFSGHDIYIYGLVTKDVVSLRTVYVEPGGEVRGDVVAREIRRSGNGKIHGSRTEVPFPGVIPTLKSPPITIFNGFASIIFTIFLAFICLIVLAVATKPVLRIKKQISTEPIKSFLVGLLGWFSIAPIFVLLLITIVGIPIAVLIMPFIIMIAIVLAFVSMAVFIGEIVAPRLGWSEGSLYVKGLVGVVAVECLQVAGAILGSMGIPFLPSLLAIIYYILIGVVLTVGMGAVITARMGYVSKRKDNGAIPSAPPPAIPVVKPPTPVHDPQSGPESSDQKDSSPAIPTPPPLKRHDEEE